VGGFMALRSRQNVTIRDKQLNFCLPYSLGVFHTHLSEKV